MEYCDGAILVSESGGYMLVCKCWVWGIKSNKDYENLTAIKLGGKLTRVTAIKLDGGKRGEKFTSWI